jgi:hypothetical protein
VSDFHLRRLSVAQARLRLARDDLAAHAANMPEGKEAEARLVELERRVEAREREVADAEHSLRALEAMLRANAREAD